MTSSQRHPPTRGEPVPHAAELTAALTRLRRTTGVPLTFSGSTNAAGVRLDRFDGQVVGPLRGARLGAGRGLGGRVVAYGRSLAIHDYVEAPGITHDYDSIIRTEGLRAMVAAPVILGRRPVAVLYAALRTASQDLGRLLDAVTAEARALEQELAARQAQARMSDAQVRLQTLALEVDDPALRVRLLETANLLGDDRQVAGAAHPGAPLLTARERDVLEQLAAGHPNQAIADALGIGLYTVKGHLKALYAKLGAHGRLDAVTTARRLGMVR